MSHFINYISCTQQMVDLESWVSAVLWWLLHDQCWLLTPSTSNIGKNIIFFMFMMNKNKAQRYLQYQVCRLLTNRRVSTEQGNPHFHCRILLKWGKWKLSLEGNLSLITRWRKRVDIKWKKKTTTAYGIVLKV